MTDAIITAIITGGLSLAGVIISNLFAAQKTNQKVETALAVTDTKIDELTREVREHNNFAKRVPALEHDVESIQKSIERLESFHINK